MTHTKLIKQAECLIQDIIENGPDHEIALYDLLRHEKLALNIKLLIQVNKKLSEGKSIFEIEGGEQWFEVQHQIVRLLFFIANRTL